jgi:hypothetical protein
LAEKAYTGYGRKSGAKLGTDTAILQQGTQVAIISSIGHVIVLL